MWHHPEAFLSASAAGSWCPWHLSGRAQDAANNLQTHRPASHCQELPGSIVSHAKVEKLSQGEQHLYIGSQGRQEPGKGEELKEGQGLKQGRNMSWGPRIVEGLVGWLPLRVWRADVPQCSHEPLKHGL